jgi:hypothetical protein
MLPEIPQFIRPGIPDHAAHHVNIYAHRWSDDAHLGDNHDNDAEPDRVIAHVHHYGKEDRDGEEDQGQGINGLYSSYNMTTKQRLTCQ